MSDFESLLNKKVEDTVPPPIFPTGTYRLRAVGMKAKPSKGDANEYISCVYVPVEPLDDVDADRIADISEEDFEGARFFHRQWLGDRRDEFALKVFLEKHGVDMSGRTYSEVLTGISGAEVLAYVEEAVGKDGETPINNVGQFAAV